MKIQTKKGAIELSIGTVVIIVLAMSMLILGIILIRNIFGTATSSITQIDQGVKNEINRLFSENNERTLVLFPDSNIIEVERGDRGVGFAVGLRNTGDSLGTFSYNSVIDKGNCASVPNIQLIGGNENNIQLDGKTTLENPRHVRMDVPQNAPLCTFSVTVTVTQTGSTATQSARMDVSVIE